MKYHLYGLVLKTDFRFRYHLIEADPDEPTDVSFSISPDPVPVPGELVSRQYESPQLRLGKPAFCIDEFADRVVLSFPGVVDYHVFDRERIVADVLLDIPDDLIETHLLGMVMAYVVEVRGKLVLHASAAVVLDGVVAFLAFNKGGKTSLAAAFVQGGCPLLTDDILAVDVGRGQAVGAAGYPQMRMWPDHAEALIGTKDGFERVRSNTEKLLIPVDAIGPGGFTAESQHIVALFVPERSDESDAAIAFERMSDSEAFKTILSNGYIVEIAEASGIRKQRFANIAQLVRTTPMYRLRYPSGVERLPAVRTAITRHIQTNPFYPRRRLID